MPIANTSPTLATVMSKCFLRAAFANSEHSAYTFPWPKAMLGSAAHQVLESVYKGEIAVRNEAEAILQISGLWENALEEQRARILDNPIQQAFLSRFGEAQKWPGYSLRRARTVLRALSIWREVSAGASRYAANLSAAGAAEERLSAFDGRLRGRLDKVFTNRDGVHLIDYKTGSIYDERSEGERQAIKADYVNQLLIYAAMYHNERGVWPVSAILEPLEGSLEEITIYPEEAIQAARKALDFLSKYNKMIADGALISDFAAKTLEPCRLCSFKAFCEPFWDMAFTPDEEMEWRHIQGSVKNIEKLPSGDIQLEIKVEKGNVEHGVWSILFARPEWFCEPDELDATGDVRFINLRPHNLARRILIANIYSELWHCRQRGIL